MSAIIKYIETAVDELTNKVTWPSWSELQSSSIIVLLATFLIALLIYGMDVASKTVLEQVYQFFG